MSNMYATILYLRLILMNIKFVMYQLCSVDAVKKKKAAEYRRKYREKNPEKVRISRMKYSAQNEEKVRNSRLKYCEKNEEKVRNSRLKYCEKNEEKVRNSRMKYNSTAHAKKRKAEHNAKYWKSNKDVITIKRRMKNQQFSKEQFSEKVSISCDVVCKYCIYDMT